MSYLHRLTLRDRQLLAWLAEHYVLSTAQITTALFPSERSAQLRRRQAAALPCPLNLVDQEVPSGSAATHGSIPLVIRPHPGRAARRRFPAPGASPDLLPPSLATSGRCHPEFGLRHNSHVHRGDGRGAWTGSSTGDRTTCPTGVAGLLGPVKRPNRRQYRPRQKRIFPPLYRHPSKRFLI
ncbi:replication-relaxation family protein [Micromonospora sp. NPDC047465]|uniref:replication-relaxation family protein n=1 Tax=Micromonospora sp. NPDC047465 TaxID=3154813 RepID=UPI00340643E0